MKFCINVTLSRLCDFRGDRLAKSSAFVTDVNEMTLTVYRKSVCLFEGNICAVRHGIHHLLSCFCCFGI